MSELRITTDHKWRQFKYRGEVPQSILNSEFNYQDEDEAVDGFICYRGTWYHLDHFMVLRNGHPFPSQWHGYTPDSFFSGVVIEISDDGEEYRIGTYIS